MSDSQLPCRSHAMLWPCHSSQGHGTARPSRVGLWAVRSHSASSGYCAALRGCITSQIKIFGHTAKSQSASCAVCLVILVASVQGKILDRPVPGAESGDSEATFVCSPKKKSTRKAAQQFEGATVDSAQNSQAGFSLKLHTSVIGTCNRGKGPPLWSSGQSFWLQIQRSRVWFPALPDFSE